MEAEFTFSWAEAAIDRIYNSANLKEAITTTASYLTEIIDELRRLNRVVEEGADYLPYIDTIISGLDDEMAEVSRDLWKAAREILLIYSLLPRMKDWEVEFKATQRLAPYIDPQMDRLEGSWLVLGNMIAHHQGWVEGELTGLDEGIEHELMLQKEWPALFPEDRPPDGLEEFAKTGWE